MGRVDTKSWSWMVAELKPVILKHRPEILAFMKTKISDDPHPHGKIYLYHEELDDLQPGDSPSGMNNTVHDVLKYWYRYKNEPNMPSSYTECANELVAKIGECLRENDIARNDLMAIYKLPPLDRYRPDWSILIMSVAQLSNEIVDRLELKNYGQKITGTWGGLGWGRC